jgi:hypothetical protein
MAFLLGGNVTKEEVIAATKDCATKLGRTPSLPELEKATGIVMYDIRKSFGTYRLALVECGLEGRGTGHPMSAGGMFKLWGDAVRHWQKLPTQLEFEQHAQRRGGMLARRCGGWRNVPKRMLEYMRMKHLEGEWKDVLEVMLKELDSGRRGERDEREVIVVAPAKPKIMIGGPMYGTPLLTSPLSCAPINEMGVVFLFGAVARQMGFVVTRLQQEFPDCEALRQVEPGRWQRMQIEFEFASRNFLLHGHRVEDCDLIVCWEHNWPECPLEVVELKYAPCIQLSGLQL